MMRDRITRLEWFIVFAMGVTLAIFAYATRQRRRAEQSTAKKRCPTSGNPRPYLPSESTCGIAESCGRIP